MAKAVRHAVQHIQDTAGCLLSFGQVFEEARPEEIRLLADMLAEWSNWSGSLRSGSFFRAVAEAWSEPSRASSISAYRRRQRDRPTMA